MATDLTIEDETGVANLVVMPKVFDKYRRVVMGARLMLVQGRIQRSPEGVIHVLAYRLVDRSADLRRLAEPELPMKALLANGDEVVKNGIVLIVQGHHQDTPSARAA